MWGAGKMPVTRTQWPPKLTGHAILAGSKNIDMEGLN